MSRHDASQNSIFTNFFFNDTATTEIYTLSLHDALPISLVLRVRPEHREHVVAHELVAQILDEDVLVLDPEELRLRSEEHTSELQSRQYLVCRLLLEKKKPTKSEQHTYELSERQ